MKVQTGARWLAKESHDLGAGSAPAQDVSCTGDGQLMNDSRPPGFTLFDCIAESKYAQSVAALVSLGFQVEGDTSPGGGDRRAQREER